MPKKIKNSNFSLFGCINAPVEQKAMMISKPFELKLSKEEEQILEEINKNISIIEKLLEKTIEQKHLLLLMKSIIDFSTKKESIETMNILKGMIDMYKEKKIDWKQYQSMPLASLIPPVLTQNSAKTVQTSEVQQGTKKQEIQVKPTTSGVEVTDELAKKVAKRRELLDKQDTINTEHTQKNKKKSEEQNTELPEKSEEGEFSNPKAVKVQMQKNVASDHMQNSKNLSLKNIKNDELLKILTKRKEISERISENNEKSEEGKFSNPTAVEVQMQKNVDIDRRQNSDEGSFLLQQLKAARHQLINNQTTVQEDNLPSWVKSEFIDSTVEKKILEEKKEQDLFNFWEIVCDSTDLSEEERQEIINFRERVNDVELRLGNEADKKRFESTVSKIVEEITRPNSILDDEFYNNLKTINDFIKDTQQTTPKP